MATASAAQTHGGVVGGEFGPNTRPSGISSGCTGEAGLWRQYVVGRCSTQPLRWRLRGQGPPRTHSGLGIDGGKMAPKNDDFHSSGSGRREGASCLATRPMMEHLIKRT
eukprot:g34121.t1